MRLDNEYASVNYNEKNNKVILEWHREAHYDDYRKPTSFALQLIQMYEADFIIDARKGFVDVAEDVEWGFNYLLPEMAKAQCKNIIFILNDHPNLEDEMNMWEKEFSKYFRVYRVKSLEEALLIRR